VVTRGKGALTYSLETAVRPTVLIYAEPFTPPSETVYERGVSLAVVSVRRNSSLALDPSIKSSNLLNNFLAAAEARRLGADEALMLNEHGRIAEGASANVFLVRGGRVLTPPPSAGLLDGITRQFVMELCGDGSLTAAEADLGPGDLGAAEEIFLTSTTREILPVARCDGRPVGDGSPGPATRSLRERFRKAVVAHAGGER
jgi:branched-chain amino acid aminotransferase